MVQRSHVVDSQALAPGKCFLSVRWEQPSTPGELVDLSREHIIDCPAGNHLPQLRDFQGDCPSFLPVWHDPGAPGLEAARALAAPADLSWSGRHLAMVRYLSVEYFKAEIAPTHWLTIWTDSPSQGST